MFLSVISWGFEDAAVFACPHDANPAHSLPLWPLDTNTTQIAPLHFQTPLGGLLSHMRLSRKWAPLLSSHTEVGCSIPRACDFAVSLDDMNCYQVPCGVLTLEIWWHLKTEWITLYGKIMLEWVAYFDFVISNIKHFDKWAVWNNTYVVVSSFIWSS